MPVSLEQAQPLFDWINERHAIYMRKEIILDAEEDPSRIKFSNSGALAWGDRPSDYWSLDHLTDDPILAEYSFCNVFRELDRVTVWIRENIREKYADHPHLWYMLAIARFINWPPTLKFLIDSGYAWPDSPLFRPENMTHALEYWKSEGNKVETGAYMIRAESDKNKEWYNWSKQKYVSEIVLGRLWDERETISYMLETEGTTLERAWEFLRGKYHSRYVGWGPFMTHQVVVDLRWTRYLNSAPDLGAWASVGPGSARGLNRLSGRPLKKTVGQAQALAEMLELQEMSRAEGVLAEYVPPIELADIQNCLCETDKWLRAKSGEGRPRSKYKVGRSSEWF